MKFKKIAKDFPCSRDFDKSGHTGLKFVIERSTLEYKTFLL